MNINIKPEEALTILTFLREYIPKQKPKEEDQRLSLLRKSIKRFENQVFKMPMEEFEKAVEEIRVHSLLGMAGEVKE